MVDKIFVINLDKDVVRLNEFDQQMKILNLEYERFPAITYDPELEERYISNGLLLSKGERGCLLSHLSIYQLLADHPEHEHYLIFEDDARTHFTGDLMQLVQDCNKKIIEKNLATPDVFYLGKGLDECMKLEHWFDKVYRTYSPLCTHAYIITKKLAKKICAGKHRSSIDQLLKGMIKNKEIVAAAIHPSLFYQDVLGTESNLRKLRQSLYNTLECMEVSDASNNVGLQVGLCVVLIVIISIVAIVIKI